MEFRQNQAIYLQIADHITERILSGTWSEGERIPSIREMSEDIVVNPNTVMRSYGYLQDLGIIYNKRGIGFFVTENAYRKTLELKKKSFIRRELPRMPVVFYSIQDEDTYYRDFRNSGILSHYAYVRKSNYLLPQMILPLLRDAVSGRSFIDPDIETRVREVRHKDENDPLGLLEPNEQIVASLLAQGLTNEQIAAKLGFHDKRTISRTNGQIYAAWGLSQNATDEKIARTRAALIVRTQRMINWDESGAAWVLDESGRWIPWSAQPSASN